MTAIEKIKKKSLASRALRKLKHHLKIPNISLFPFALGKPFFLKTFLAYQPDSHNTFNAHPEFNDLFKKFISHNKLNNAGDVIRLWSLILNIKQVLAENIDGDLAELGVWRGNTAAILAFYASQYSREVFLFDTYQGFDKKDLEGIDANQEIKFHDTSLSLVKKIIGNESSCCHFIQGYFPDSLKDKMISGKFAIVSLDCDLYEPMKEGLNYFYPLMDKGALFLLHDYSSMSWAGAKKAIDEFCVKYNERIILMPDKSGSAFIRKSF
jgi:Macrocin-O-methyltransferase (TylF)